MKIFSNLYVKQLYYESENYNFTFVYLEGEIESLCRKVTDDIGRVTPPKTQKSLLLGYPLKTVNHSLKNTIKN